MSKSLYISATEARSGKSAILLGVMQLLRTHLRRVAIFRPVISDLAAGETDHDINLMLDHFKLEMEYDQAYGYTLSEAMQLINDGRKAELLENVLAQFKALEKEYDFVLCESSDYLGSNSTAEYEINNSIASNLGCPMLAVIKGLDKNEQEIVDTAVRSVESLLENQLEVMGIIVNRTPQELADSLLDEIGAHLDTPEQLLAFRIPEDRRLSNPTVHDVVNRLGADVLYGHEGLDIPVDNFVTAAMRIDNYLKYMREGSLIVTPGDRSDIILASIGARQSSAFGDIAGIVLTGGILLSEDLDALIKGWAGPPLPILSVEEHTYMTTQTLQDLHATINMDNPAKISTAIGLFESCVDTEALRSRVISSRSRKVTPLMFEYNLIEKAKLKRQHIVLPEGTSERVLMAADELCRRDVVELTLLGDPKAIRVQASGLGLDIENANLVDPVNSERFDDYVDRYFEARQHKGIRREDACDRMLDPTYFGTMMVKAGHADGMVSGSINTTAQTIRPAFEFVKTKPDASIVSSVFLMCTGDRVLAFGDCAVNPNPSAQQLAEIALSSAETARIFGVDPYVAMLSYSTGESGSGKDVQKVAEATRIARELAKERGFDLPIEGPIQYDAAVDANVARTKMPNSEVAGRATVMIFPDLNAGNNTYKAVQRSIPGSTAIGPILQGLNKPVNDLSRGCKVRDIVNTVAITAVQAQAEQDV